MSGQAKAKEVYATEIDNVSNDSVELVKFQEPYVVEFAAVGVRPFLCHRWSIEGQQTDPGEPDKGVLSKKVDNLPAYVWRDEHGNLCIPGLHFQAAIIEAAGYQQDPRSRRKSAKDLFRAAIYVREELLPFEPRVKNWDFEHQEHAVVQMAGITRVRPAMKTGWRVSGTIEVGLPEYISPAKLNATLQMAGRVQGVGDYRPTYGRFQVVHFKKIKAE